MRDLDMKRPGPGGARGDLCASVLSAREHEVAEMMSSGLSNAAIAERLGVTRSAIKFHLASIYRKLGVGNRTEAAVVYLGLMEREVS